MMLIQKCINCGFEFGVKKSETNGVTGSFCQDCFFWTKHYNYFRRKEEKEHSKINVQMMLICKKFLEDNKKSVLRRC